VAAKYWVLEVGDELKSRKLKVELQITNYKLRIFVTAEFILRGGSASEICLEGRT
jgi:hypothetical protein